MSILNKDEILNGTPQKRFDKKYEELKKNYTEETAQEFYNTYKDESLSFILKNISSILSEGCYFGARFILDIVNNNFIPFHKIASVQTIVEEKIDKCNGLNMDYDNGTGLYYEIKENLDDELKALKNTINLSMIACKSGGEEMLNTVFDYIYEISETGCEKELTDIINSVVIYCIEANTRITLLAYFLVKGYTHVYLLEDLVRHIPNPAVVDYRPRVPQVVDSGGIDVERLKMDVARAVSIIGKDELIISRIDTMPFNTKVYIKGLISIGLKKPELTYTESTNHFMGLTAALEDIYECTTGDSIVNDINKCKKYDYLKSLKNYYESCRDFEILSHDDEDEVSEIVEKYEDYIDDISSDIAMMEWTDNGEPDSVIKNHIMTQKEIEKEKNEKEEKKKKAKEDAIKKSESEEDELFDYDEDGNKMRKDWKEANKENYEARKNAFHTVLNIVKSFNLKCENGYNPEKINEDFYKGERTTQWVGAFKKESLTDTKIADIKKEIKEKFQKYDSDFKVTYQNKTINRVPVFEIYVQVRKTSKYYIDNMYVEASKDKDEEVEEFRREIHGDKEKTNVKPQKPKEDLPTKIQNKAIDAEAARQQKRGIRQEKNTKLKNAGKAIMAGPKGWLNSVKKFTDSFNKMDVKRRKEFFLKPGYRHKIFRNAKWALLYGGAARYKLSSLPFAMLIRHFSKDKDRRIRNELTRELETEIRICEEKINDANANGDQQEKYKLMRIKDKLTAEKHRVQLNSNFI